MALIEVKVPDIGDFKGVQVIELLVKPGDRVAAEQSLVTVESDKASMEIPSSHAGVVREMKVALGDTVSEGTLLLMLEAEGAAAAPVAAPAATPVATPVATPEVTPAPAAAGNKASTRPEDNLPDARCPSKAGTALPGPDIVGLKLGMSFDEALNHARCAMDDGVIGFTPRWFQQLRTGSTVLRNQGFTIQRGDTAKRLFDIDGLQHDHFLVMRTG